MARQLTLDLPTRTAVGRDDFFVTASNDAALATLDDWQNWPSGKMILCGPEGAGKSHLTHVWASATGAAILSGSQLAQADPADLANQPCVAVEDVDRIAGNETAEHALFHLHNLCLANGGRLLMTGRQTPAQWPVLLPDLKSRLMGTMVATLAPPDDTLLTALLMKLFADRQVIVPPALLPYLLGRMERSFAAARALVAALDDQGLAEGRAITRGLAAKVLDNMGEPGA